MKKLLVILPYLILGLMIAAYATQPQWFTTYTKVVTTDTVRIDRPYEVLKIDTLRIEIPKKVYIYQNRVDTVREVKIIRDTIKVVSDAGTTSYHTSFFTQYPYSHRVLGLYVKLDTVSISTIAPAGEISTKKWAVNTRFQPVTIGYDENSKLVLTYDKLDWKSRLANNSYSAFLQLSPINGSPAIGMEYNQFLTNSWSVRFDAMVGANINTNIRINYIIK